MESNLKSEELYEHFKQTRILLIESVEMKETTKIQELVILVHSLCTSHSLQCLNQEQEKCQFPMTWNKSNQGVYRLKYIISKGQYKDKIVQFRLIDNGDSLSVNFVIQNTQTLYCAQLSIDKSIQENIKILSNELRKILNQKKNFNNYNNQQRGRPIPLLQPVPLQPNPINPGFDRPVPFDVGPGTIPIRSPFNRQQYVGPNSGIFAGRGERNPQFPTGANRPPFGARWDPVDPFGEEGPKNTNEFFGFNQWGQPKNDHNPFGRGGFGGSGGFI